jgi:hypothetical protein
MRFEHFRDEYPFGTRVAAFFLNETVDSSM